MTFPLPFILCVEKTNHKVGMGRPPSLESQNSLLVYHRQVCVPLSMGKKIQKLASRKIRPPEC